MTRHHLVPQRWLRQGRLHLHEPEVNLIDLCTKCHRLVESKERSGGHVHRARLRAVLTREQIAYGHRVMGVDHFDFLYPLATDSRLVRCG